MFESLLVGYDGSVAGATALRDAAALVEKVQLLAGIRSASVVTERERIASDLHDSIIQEILAVGMSLSGAVREVADRPAVATRVESAITDLERVIGELRATVLNLRERDERDLRTAIQNVAAAMVPDVSVTVAVDVDESAATELSSWAVKEVLMIVREALSNAYRHGQAHSVRVSIARAVRGLVLRVIDDGAGFDPAEPTAGMGLGNMLRRAETLGGNITIESSLGAGTHVAVFLPSGS